MSFVLLEFQGGWICQGEARCCQGGEISSRGAATTLNEAHISGNFQGIYILRISLVQAQFVKYKMKYFTVFGPQQSFVN